MKKIVSIIVAVILLCGAVAFAQIDLTGMSLDELRDLQSQIALAIADKVGDGVFSKGTVIVDNEYCKITATGIEFEYGDPNLKVIVENKSDVSISTLVEQMVVNGWDVYSGSITSIAAKSKSIGAYDIEDMTEMGITDVKDITEIRMILTIYDDDNWETLMDTDEITLTFAPAE